MTALINFHKEFTRFTLKYKVEIFQEIKTTMDNEDDLKMYIEKSIATIESDLISLDKKTKASKRQSTGDKVKAAPRPLSAYNKFIKKELPEIAKQNPEMNNKTRMSKASEKWKGLTDEEKEVYKNMVFEPKTK